MKIIIRSGGQTGADRAALDWATIHGIEHRGWCPKGKKAEDGVIPKKYNLFETKSGHYAERTKMNVEDSDGTIIFSISDQLTVGSLLTKEWANQINKPWLHVYKRMEAPSKDLRAFILQWNIHDLNVAGPRKSNEPEIELFVK